jgi:Zn-dependent protease
MLYQIPAFICLIIAAVIHEVAHAVTAEKLGDPTARSLGRISLNPIKHIDPFMTIILPGMLVLANSPVIFGGAKPVPVNPSYFKNPRQGMAIVAAAGPISNIFLALFGFAALKLLGIIGIISFFPEFIAKFIIITLVQWILINIVLAIFNLFPIPPLDGGRIVTGILPRNLAIKYAKLEPYGILIVFALLFAGVMDSYLLPTVNFIMKGLDNVISIF